MPELPLRSQGMRSARSMISADAAKVVPGRSPSHRVSAGNSSSVRHAENYKRTRPTAQAVCLRIGGNYLSKPLPAIVFVPWHEQHGVVGELFPFAEICTALIREMEQGADGDPIGALFGAIAILKEFPQLLV